MLACYFSTGGKLLQGLIFTVFLASISWTTSATATQNGGFFTLESSPEASAAGSAYPANSARQHRRMVKVGVMNGMAPLLSHSHRNDNAAGLAADYLDLIARSKNLQIAIRFFDDSGSMASALASGEIDAAVGADAALPESRFPRSRPFYSAPVVVISRAETRNSAFFSDSNLSYLRSMLDGRSVTRSIPGATLDGVDTYYEGLKRVATHKDAAFVGDTISMSAYTNAILFYMLKARPSPTGLHNPYAFVFNSDRLDLLRQFDDALASISDNTHRAIKQRWVLAEKGRFDGKLDFTEAEKQWIESHPRISIASSSLVIPFAFRDSFGRAAGISTSVLDIVTAETGLVFSYEYYDSALDQLRAVRDGKADMASAMQGNYPDFAGLISSVPLLHTTYALVSRSDGPSPRHIGDLAGLRVALVSASPVRSMLEERAVAKPSTIVPVTTALDALNAVAAGKADATTILYPSAEYLLAQFYQDQDLRISGIAQPDIVPLVYPVSERNPLLASIINKVIHAISDDQMDFIISQWQYSEPLEFRWAARGPLIRGLLIAGAGITALVVVWLGILLTRLLRRRRNDRIMQERLTLKRQMLDANPNPMYVWNPDGIMIACNEAFERLVKDPIVGMNLTLEGIATLDKESREKIRHAYDKVKATRQPYFAEMTVNLGGRGLTGQHWVVPLLDSHGELQAILGGWVDLTELKATERSLQQAIKRADAANEAKTLFLATISHEIRTPMNIVVGALELLKEGKAGDVSAPAQHQAAVAYDSATALLVLLNDILHYSKIEAGELSLHYTCANLAEALPRWVASFNRSADKKGIALSSHIAPGFPTALVFDGGRLRQIVNNLVANAIKFTLTGSVTVAASAAPGRDGMCEVNIAVQDTGIGIPSAAIPQLFSPFQQGASTTYERYGGTGMGLAISKKLTELFGGTISLQSIEEQGTTVTVSIPMRYGEIWPTSEDVETAYDERLPHLDLLPTSVVLIVDDHPSNRMLLETQLRLLDLQVVSTASGAEALEVLNDAWTSGNASRSIAAVITDCSMPGMDGYALTREISAAALASQVPVPPVIGYSADGTSSAYRRCLESGMLGLLVKPVELATLRAVLVGVPPPPTEPLHRTTEPGEPTPCDYLQSLTQVFGTLEKAKSFVVSFLELFDQDLEHLRQVLQDRDERELQDWLHRARGAAHAVRHAALVKRLAVFSELLRNGDTTAQAANGLTFIEDCRQILAEMRVELDLSEPRNVVDPNASNPET